MAKQSAKKTKTAAPIDSAVPTTALIAEENSDMISVEMPPAPPHTVSPQAATDLFADIIADAVPAQEAAASSAMPAEADELAMSDADDGDEEADNVINEACLWRDDGWTARIISNDEDDGWAVEMTRDGEREPSLIGPWTMGRDKKNPKPLDKPAFHTLVKTANEFRRRSEQQLQAQLHKSIWIDGEAGTIKVTLDIVPDDDFPYADLKAWDDNKELLAKAQVAATFRLNAESAEKWIANGYGNPR